MSEADDVYGRMFKAEDLVKQLTTQLEAVKEIAMYANTQANMAHSRLLKESKRYDDAYWQPVLDIIRHDLLQIVTIEKNK